MTAQSFTKKLTLASLVAGLAIASQLTLPSSASAQELTTSPTTLSVEAGSSLEKVTVTAIPPRVGEDGTLKASPGETLQANIKVRNNSDQTITVNSIVQDFIVGEDGETPVPIFDDLDQRWSLTKWVTLSTQFQELAPNEIGMIAVIINVPQDALPGGKYAMVTHQPVPANAGEEHEIMGAQESASRVSQRVGTLLYVIVDGPINEEAYLRDLTMPNFTEFGPVPFALAVDNQSDIHIRPQISVEIRNIFGKKVESIQLEQKNVFPLMSRDFSGVWDRVWGIGLYKATAVMSYGETGQVAKISRYFWLLPLTLILAFVILLLILIVLWIVIKRHLHHRNDVNQKRVEMLEKRLAELESNNLEDIG